MNLIPDGPLHPELAATAAAGGLVLTVLARRWDRGRRGARALSVAWAVAALAIVEVSPIDVWRALSDDARLQVVGATLVGALSGWVLAHDAPRASGLLLLVSAAVAWATVPDTEWPLAAGAALLSITIAEIAHGGSRRHAGEFVASGALVGAASAVGSTGDAARVWYPLLVLLVTAVAAQAWRSRH